MKVQVSAHAALRFEERGQELLKLASKLAKQQLGRSFEQLRQVVPSQPSKRKLNAQYLGSLIDTILAEGGTHEVVWDAQTRVRATLVRLAEDQDLVAVCRGNTVVTVLTEEMVAASKHSGLYLTLDQAPFVLTTTLKEQTDMGSHHNPAPVRAWALEYFTKNPKSSLSQAVKACRDARLPPLPGIISEARQKLRGAALASAPVVAVVAVAAPAKWNPSVVLVAPVEPVPVPAAPPSPPIPEVSVVAPVPPSSPPSAEAAIVEQAKALLVVMRSHGVATCTLDLSDEGAAPKLDLSFDFRSRVSGSYAL